MAGRKAHRRRVLLLSIVVGLAIGLAFDALDLLIDVGLLTEGPLIANIRAAPQLWMRGAILVLAVAASVAYARSHLAMEDMVDAAERYRTLAESAQDDIFIVGRDYRVEYMNTFSANEFGRTPEELEGTLLSELFPAEEAQRARADLEQAFAGRDSYSEMEFTFDGGPKWLGTRLVPLRGHDGRIEAALGIARDITGAKRRMALGDALSRISEVVHARLSVDEILQAVSVEAASAAGVDSSIVATCDDEGWTVRFAPGFPDGLIGMRLTSDDAAGAVTASATRSVFRSDDAQHDDRLTCRIIERFGIRSMLAVPLLTRGGVLGVLFFTEREKQIVFPPDVVQFVTRVGSTVSLAIDNARLYEEERSVADSLQSAILMLPDCVPGIDFAHAYHSATEAARVGGDFYDIFELERDRIGITIGDISGHGIDAAVLTSLIKNGIRVEATQEDRPPGEVVASANRLLLENSPSEIFATVFYGVLDRGDGTLLYCNAGHTTGCVLTSAGEEKRRLEANSPLAGALPGQTFSLSTARLDPGDLLFLYTDGLTEARRDGEFFGEERLFSVLASANAPTAAETVESVMAEVMSFAGDKLRDDLAILCVRLPAEEPVGSGQVLTSRTTW